MVGPEVQSPRWAFRTQGQRGPEPVSHGVPECQKMTMALQRFLCRQGARESSRALLAHAPRLTEKLQGNFGA